MTLLDKLQTHKGGLLQLKTQLYWYGRGGWDNNPGRICLLLDAIAASRSSRRTTAATAPERRRHPLAPRSIPVAAFLLIDGQPHWVWVAEEDIERL